MGVGVHRAIARKVALREQAQSIRNREVIANRDGPVHVTLLCGSQCPTIHVGDYLELDGEKQSEQAFDATEVTVSR